MTLQDFIQEWTDKKCKFPTGFGGECMDLYRQYCKEVAQVPQSPPVKGAVNVWDNFDPSFDRIANTPTGVPNPGDIVIWGTKVGEFGHIAVFVSGTSKKFQSFDQNWPAGSLCHIQDHTYNGVLGWLHKKPEIATPLPSTGKIFTQEEYDKVRLERDDNWNKLQAEISDHQKDLDDIAVAAGSSNTRSGILARIGVWEDEKEAARKATKALRDEVDTLNTEKQDHLKRIDDLQKAIEQQRLDNELKVSGLVDQLDILREKITQTQTKQNWLDQVLSYFKRK